MLSHFIRVRLFATPWTSPGQNTWVSFPSPGDLPDPRIEPASLTSPALVGRFFTTSTAWEAPVGHFVFGFISFCRGVLSSTKFQKACAVDKHAPPRCCNWMHWSICRNAGADPPLLGHLIIHLAPSDFISFHGCYLCSLVTTTQGLPQPGSLIMFY